jgi:opacity protein-like surface antigen
MTAILILLDSAIGHVHELAPLRHLHLAAIVVGLLQSPKPPIHAASWPGPVPGTLASATFTNRWLTTATGKLGYAWDRVLLYGKAGGAWVGAYNPNLTVGGAGQTLSSSTTNNFGWTAGVGVEWAFAGNWSARAEYDFIGLQNQTVTVAGGGGHGPGSLPVDFSLQAGMIAAEASVA